MNIKEKPPAPNGYYLEGLKLINDYEGKVHSIFDSEKLVSKEILQEEINFSVKHYKEAPTVVIAENGEKINATSYNLTAVHNAIHEATDSAEKNKKMKYFEFVGKFCYYALIKAESEERAKEIYQEQVADIEERDDAENSIAEVDIETAIKYGITKCELHGDELREYINEVQSDIESLLITDGCFA